jgi:propanediol dehydratase large subunit
MGPAGWAAVITAICAGLASVISAVAGIMSARAKCDAECQTKLKLAWIEAEAYAEELHTLKLEKFHTDGNDK